MEDLKDCLVELSAQGRVDTMHEDMHQLTNNKGLPVHNDDI